MISLPSESDSGSEATEALNLESDKEYLMSFSGIFKISATVRKCIFVGSSDAVYRESTVYKLIKPARLVQKLFCTSLAAFIILYSALLHRIFAVRGMVI